MESAVRAEDPAAAGIRLDLLAHHRVVDLENLSAEVAGTLAAQEILSAGAVGSLADVGQGSQSAAGRAEAGIAAAGD